MFDKKSFIRDCIAIREKSPLVLNITNYVAMNIAANGLLAVGASPLMSFCPQEMEELAGRCDALTVNLGCLDNQVIEGSRLAAETAQRLGKKWVLDPVGAGISSLRTDVSAQLTSLCHPSVIRGNASEICSLTAALKSTAVTSSEDPDGAAAPQSQCTPAAGIWGDAAGGHWDCGAATAPKGVQSMIRSAEAVGSATVLSEMTGAVVCVSGATDYIVRKAPGEMNPQVATITNGSALMPMVTALGCTATALCGAFMAVEEDAFSAALNTMALMGVAGEIAAQECPGTGSLAVRIIDCLSTFNPELISQMVKE